MGTAVGLLVERLGMSQDYPWHQESSTVSFDLHSLFGIKEYNWTYRIVEARDYETFVGRQWDRIHPVSSDMLFQCTPLEFCLISHLILIMPIPEKSMPTTRKKRPTRCIHWWWIMTDSSRICWIRPGEKLVVHQKVVRIPYRIHPRKAESP